MSQDVRLSPEQLAEIRDVSDRAQAGDQTAVPRLRELLKAYPAMADYHGDLAQQAAACWVGLAAGDNLLLREALSCKVAALRESLAGENPHPLTALLVDRVILTWLSVNFFTATEANALAARETPALLAFRTRRRLQAERAHYAALGALATLQKLHPPAAGTAAKALPPAAGGTNDIANRLSEYFADLVPPPARRAPVTVNYATKGMEMFLTPEILRLVAVCNGGRAGKRPPNVRRTRRPATRPLDPAARKAVSGLIGQLLATVPERRAQRVLDIRQQLTPGHVAVVVDAILAALLKTSSPATREGLTQILLDFGTASFNTLTRAVGEARVAGHRITLAGILERLVPALSAAQRTELALRMPIVMAG